MGVARNLGIPPGIELPLRGDVRKNPTPRLEGHNAITRAAIRRQIASIRPTASALSSSSSRMTIAHEPSISGQVESPRE